MIKLVLLLNIYILSSWFLKCYYFLTLHAFNILILLFIILSSVITYSLMESQDFLFILINFCYNSIKEVKNVLGPRREDNPVIKEVQIISDTLKFKRKYTLRSQQYIHSNCCSFIFYFNQTVEFVLILYSIC